MNTKFKVGDRFTTKYYPERWSDVVFEIVRISDYFDLNNVSFPYTVKVIEDSKHGNTIGYKTQWRDEGDMIIISNNNKINMSKLVEKIKLMTKSEPEKSAIEAEIRTSSDDFTSEGKDAFIEYLYQKNKADFDTTVVQPLLAEKKE